MDESEQRNPATPLYLRIFVASPGDVSEERKIAREVIERLPKDPLLRDRISVCRQRDVRLAQSEVQEQSDGLLLQHTFDCVPLIVMGFEDHPPHPPNNS